MSTEVYAWGLVSTSVCTDLTDKEEIEDEVNRVHPTGIDSRWKISDEPTFRTGEPNGKVCEDNPTRHHYLLHC